MNNIALITALFDYPDYYEPSFYKNALKYFSPEDIHIVRNSGLITNGSYYDKLFFYKTVKVLEYIETNIVGKYDLEILTLPRTYERVEITQSKTSIVNIKSPGTLELKSAKNMVGQVFVDRGNGRFEWVLNLDEKALNAMFSLQPGNYKLVCRERDQKSTGYTQEKKFKIESIKNTLINL